MMAILTDVKWYLIVIFILSGPFLFNWERNAQSFSVNWNLWENLRTFPSECESPGSCHVKIFFFLYISKGINKLWLLSQSFKSFLSKYILRGRKMVCTHALFIKVSVFRNPTKLHFDMSLLNLFRDWLFLYFTNEVLMVLLLDEV